MNGGLLPFVSLPRCCSSGRGRVERRDGRTQPHLSPPGSTAALSAPLYCTLCHQLLGHSCDNTSPSSLNSLTVSSLPCPSTVNDAPLRLRLSPCASSGISSSPRLPTQRVSPHLPLLRSACMRPILAL